MNGIGYERRGERRSFEATAFVATADAWRGSDVETGSHRRGMGNTVEHRKEQ